MDKIDAIGIIGGLIGLTLFVAAWAQFVIGAW